MSVDIYGDESIFSIATRSVRGQQVHQDVQGVIARSGHMTTNTLYNMYNIHCMYQVEHAQSRLVYNYLYPIVKVTSV